MAFLDKTGLQTLTNKLVQGDAIKVASSKGTTIKEVIDNIQRECESVALPNTMTLENRVNEFKIGQSRDIDVSGDIEEGISQIEFKGQTYQNLLYNAKRIFGSTSCDVVILDAKKLSFEIIYKNDITDNTAANRATIESDFKNMLQPNKVYTFIYKYTLLENPKNQDCQLGIAIDMWGDNLANSKICKKNGFSDINIAKVTTANSEKFDSMATRINFINKKGQNSKWRIDGLLILEGDYSQIPINEIPQYFEGIKSSFEDKVANINIQGKNLFDYREYSKDYQATVRPDINGFYYNCKSGAGYGGYIVSTLVEPNTTYSLSAERVGEATHTRLEIGIKDHEGHKKIFDTYYQSAQRTILTFKTPNQVGSDGKLYFKIWSTIYNGSSYTINNFIGVANIQLEKGKPTSFEPYCNENYKFDIKEPLRRLPNGVCDEIRNNNGKWELVRRIGKTVLDETYDYALWGNTPSDGYFTCHANNYLQGKDITFSANKKNVICDTFAVSTGTGAFRNMSFYFTNPHITVLSSEANSISKFKEWIAKNPITLYYELVIPIITPIDPIEFNVSQGTTININSDITPISTHEVILNRSGQVEQGIELIADLRSRIDKLEKAYDSNLIATQYRLNNLKLNYELEREED